MGDHERLKTVTVLRDFKNLKKEYLLLSVKKNVFGKPDLNDLKLSQRVIFKQLFPVITSLSL